MTIKEAKIIMENLIYLYRPLGGSLEAWDMAIEALEKADKYRWHDLRKNPDDLPYMDGDYLCFIDNEPYSYCSVCEWDNPNWYNYNGTESDNVIAWQYIEPLERI